MVLVVDLLDILCVGNVFLAVLARHWHRWAIHHSVQLKEEGARLFLGKIRTWLVQEGARDLKVLSEDQLSTGGVQAGAV